jgi:hypothetical protein
MNFFKKLEKQELKHKAFTFTIILIVTILITRGITLIKDPNFFIKGYELHHFYYGIILLIITILFMLFGKKHLLISLTLAAISIGLIIDQFLFIFGIEKHISYTSTFLSAIIFAVIIITIVIAIKFLTKSK